MYAMSRPMLWLPLQLELLLLTPMAYYAQWLTIEEKMSWCLTPQSTGANANKSLLLDRKSSFTNIFLFF